MTSKQFRTTLMIIALIALVEIVVGMFYYFVFFKPKKEMENIRLEQSTVLEEKRIEQSTMLEKSKIEEKTRMEEIRLEVKQIDLEFARIKRWEEAGSEFDELRAAEEEMIAKQASMTSCMRVVVENYHNQWNSYCEKLELPNSCLLGEKDSKIINDDYMIGKIQCEEFFD